MDDKFYKLLNYYRSVSISKKLVEHNILTDEESKNILNKLKNQYKVQEIIDEFKMSDL